MNMSFPQMLNFYLRLVIFGVCVSAVALALCAGAKQAFAASLKPVAVLSGDVLTVGDLFDGVEAEKASYVLGPAPAPGKDMVLDARSLMRVAIALDLPWRPDSSAATITVRRDATLIDADTIKAGIIDAMKSKGLEDSFELSVTGGTGPIALPPGLPATFDVTALDIDRTRDTFTATVAAPSADDAQKTMNLSGSIRYMVSVPVMRSTIKNGDIIGERDFDFIEIYARELQPDMILDAETLVGMTPRRVIAPGKPVRGIDIIAPELVSRGDNVTLVFDSAPLYLTAKGKALQSGGKGDMVRVVNIASSRTIEGTVTADGTIVVTP